jgi:Dolichyl-phosphate-mannose-protein mannosyltransferase
VQARAGAISREQACLLGVWGLAVLGCLLGITFHPAGDAHPGIAGQGLDLVRVITTTSLAIVLVLGPGLAVRAARPHRRLELGFVPLPGLALLALTGTVAWILASAGIHPRVVCIALQLPILGGLLVTVLRVGPREIVSPEERSALLIIGLALGVAIARSLWSLGPPGELYSGTILRTLEVGDRSDSAISYGVVRLLTNGTSPFGPLAHLYFYGFTFSDRGPLAGLASAPVALLSGGSPTGGIGTPRWSPFDAQGFMAYRLAMMTFAATAYLSLWTLTRRLGGEKAARLALLLAATTPFLVHEIWFTWPKLFAASLVLLSAVSLIDGRPLVAGLLVGAGYLAHPLALLFVPALVLLALWPIAHPRLTRPQVRPTLYLLAGLAAFLVAWRLVNGSHYTQGNFLSYLTEAGSNNKLHGILVRLLGGHPSPVTLSVWLSDRLVSIGNTLVPLRLFLLSAHDLDINALSPRCFPFCAGNSPAIVHFFFQYWTTVPFGLGIAFFPLLLQSLWRAVRRWPWAITLAVIIPFVGFAVYWGGASTGLLREGLHPWVLTLLVVVAVQQRRDRFPWLRNRPLRALLALRSLEVLLVAMLPTLVTRHRLYQPQFALTDTVAVLAMVTLTAYLGLLMWREPARSSDAGRSAPREIAPGA